MGSVGQGDEARHELSATGRGFRAMVLIKHQGAPVGKLVFDLFPPQRHQVHAPIGGQFGADKEQRQWMACGQKNAIRGQGACGLKIMV